MLVFSCCGSNIYITLGLSDMKGLDRSLYFGLAFITFIPYISRTLNIIEYVHKLNCSIIEPRHEKTGILLMRKQRCRSAVQ